MTMKKDAKFEELTRHFKTDMRNLMNFDPSNWKSQIFSFSCAPFEQRIYCFSWKSTEELSFMKLKRVTKFGEESTCCLKIGISNLTNFDLEYSKSLKNFHFNGLLLSKVYIVWAKKVQRSYLSWHWRVMQNLKKNWLVAWKMTWGILQIFTRALKSVKIGTLIRCFCPK